MSGKDTPSAGARPDVEFVRPSDVQRAYGIHRATLYRWIARGLLPLHKVGNSSFVEAKELRRIITGKGTE